METGVHVESPAISNAVFSGNLVEFCSQGALLCNWDMEANPDRCFTDCAYTDNEILFSGFETFGDDSGYFIRDAASFTSQGGPNMYQGSLSVSGNVFLLASGRLIQIDVFDKQYAYIYSGNTYAQLKDGIWLNIGDSDSEYYGRQQIKSTLGDAAATVLSIG